MGLPTEPPTATLMEILMELLMEILMESPTELTGGRRKRRRTNLLMTWIELLAAIWMAFRMAPRLLSRRIVYGMSVLPKWGYGLGIM